MIPPLYAWEPVMRGFLATFPPIPPGVSPLMTGPTTATGPGRRRVEG